MIKIYDKYKFDDIHVDFNQVGNDELFQELSNLGVALHSYNSLFNANEQIKDLLSTSIYYNGNTFNTTLSGLLAASYLYGADKVLSAVLPGIGSASNDDVLKALYVFKGNYIPFDPANRGTQEIEGRSMLSHAVHHASHAVSHAVSTVSHAAADAAAAAKRAAEAAAAKAAAEAEAARRAAAEAEAARHAAEQIAAAAKHAAEEAQRQAELVNEALKGLADEVKNDVADAYEAYRRAVTPDTDFVRWMAKRLNLKADTACVLIYQAQHKNSAGTGNKDLDTFVGAVEFASMFTGQSENVEMALYPYHLYADIHTCMQRF